MHYRPKRDPASLMAVRTRQIRRCSICLVYKEREHFQIDNGNIDGLRTRCRSCQKQRSHESYIRNKEKIMLRQKAYNLTEKGRIAQKNSMERSKKKPQYKARYMLTNAVRDKRIIKPKSCSKCGISNVRIHGHHYDYTKPLEVVWVCNDCHNWIHKNESHLIIYN